MHALFQKRPDASGELQVSHEYAYPVEKVWAAITIPARIADWMGAEWLSDPDAALHAGAVFDYRFKGTTIESRAHVLRFDPPHLFEHSWFENIPPATTVRWALEPMEAGCRLTLTHRFSEPDDAPRTAAGWSVHLGSLEAWLSGKSAAPADWQELRDRYARNFGPEATRDGRLVQIDGHAAIRFERILHRPVGQVWNALTTPRGIKGWMQAKAEIDPRPGGRLELAFHAFDHEIMGEVLAFEPPRLFEFTWPEAVAGADSVVRFELEPYGDDFCRLWLTHHLPNSEDMTGFASGWHWHLDGVEAAVDGVDTAWDAARWNLLKTMYGMTLG